MVLDSAWNTLHVQNLRHLTSNYKGKSCAYVTMYLQGKKSGSELTSVSRYLGGMEV